MVRLNSCFLIWRDLHENDATTKAEAIVLVRATTDPNVGGVSVSFETLQLAEAARTRKQHKEMLELCPSKV
jgi:hypothetical protein